MKRSWTSWGVPLGVALGAFGAVLLVERLIGVSVLSLFGGPKHGRPTSSPIHIHGGSVSTQSPIQLKADGLVFTPLFFPLGNLMYSTSGVDTSQIQIGPKKITPTSPSWSLTLITSGNQGWVLAVSGDKVIVQPKTNQDGFDGTSSSPQNGVLTYSRTNSTGAQDLVLSSVGFAYGSEQPTIYPCKACDVVIGVEK